MKNPYKIHYLELKESINVLVAENKDYLDKNIKIKEILDGKN